MSLLFHFKTLCLLVPGQKARLRQTSSLQYFSTKS